MIGSVGGSRVALKVHDGGCVAGIPKAAAVASRDIVRVKVKVKVIGSGAAIDAGDEVF